MRILVINPNSSDAMTAASVEYGFTMMGEGEIDFPWIVEQLESVGYEGDYALEYELPSLEPEKGLKPFYEKCVGMHKLGEEKSSFRP